MKSQINNNEAIIFKYFLYLSYTQLFQFLQLNGIALNEIFSGLKLKLKL